MASILVIDDDKAVLTTIRLLLERDDHQVVVSDNGAEGLQILQSRAFDLIVVDIFMPDMDGLETMNLIRRLRPAVPIIVISGREFQFGSCPPPDFLRMATALGAASGVRKPFRPRDLLDAVRGCLSDAKKMAS